MNSNASNNSGLGARLDAEAITDLLDHVFTCNERSRGRGLRLQTPCIWGTHGIGKTALVEDYARKREWEFVYCAPAQFEEMGDLHGLPIETGDDDRRVTEMAPPEWVPQGEGPGILLLDDLNRADERILRGLMQLLQMREMFSWSLPARWHIVATCNPEASGYLVTPMDDAMLTRMIHMTMHFDVHVWARWARRAGVDPRGIAFVLTYPELVSGQKTTPRTLTQFFGLIADVDDLEANLDLVHQLACSALDDVTAATFVSFVKDNLDQLVDPREILDADDFGAVAGRLEELAESADGGKRVDRLGTVCTRLYLELTGDQAPLTEDQRENLVAFMLLEVLPNDLRMSLHRDLLADGGPELESALQHPELATLLIDAL